ncbi:MAG: hypothetical protein R3C13_06635 [Hyphomonas sp.]|uniref:hypothetical protein n=1 Tax=Hyphomonas sp. TaxID=87 RepID=UPI003529684E
MLKPALTALCGLFLAMPAFAAGLSAEQVIERMIVTESEDGSTEVELVPAETVTPGEELVYSLNFRNDGEAAAENVVLTVPVPSEVSYVENSAATGGALVAFSADGGKSFAPRGDLKVSVDGESREALAGEITHVRWTFRNKIEPGSSGTLMFHAILK